MRRVTHLRALTIPLAIHVAALAWATAPVQVHAQSATIAMTADRTTLGMGDTLRLRIEAEVDNMESDELSPPDLSAFRVVSRSVSQPRLQIQFGFGGGRRMVQSTTVHDYVLAPTQPGRFEIQPARIRTGNRTIVSNGLTIVVTAQTGQATPPGQALPPREAPTGALDGAQFDEQAFLRTVVSTKTPYLGEQVTVTMYLYVRGNLRENPTVIREATADGFWIHDLLLPTRTMNAQAQIVNGTRYKVYMLRRFAAFPLREGELSIGAMTLELETGSAFSILGPPGQSMRRESVIVPITAKPLPTAGKPSGRIAVGDFTVQARLDRARVATGDALTLTAVAEGTGNVNDLVLSPGTVDGLKVLQPEVRDHVQAPGDLVGGSRTWSWLIIPEQPGTHVIPPLTLRLFDPSTDRYIQRSTQALTLTAAGNAAAPTASAEAGPGQELPPTEPLEFGPVRNRSELRRGETPLAGSSAYVLLAAAPPLLWLMVLIIAFARRRFETRNQANAGKRALKVARKRLRSAKTLADSGQAGAFYGEVQMTLQEALEARLSKATGGFTHRELQSHLAQQGMDEDLIGRLVDELEGLEFARFSAPGVSAEEMEQCARRVGALIDRIERFTPHASEAP